MNYKNNFFVFIIISFLVFSCSKQSSQTSINNTNTGLIGDWEWLRTDGGLANHIHDTPFSINKNITLKITSDNKYFLYENGILTSSGDYRLETRNCIHDHKDKSFINFSSLSDLDMMIEELDTDKLEL